MLFRWHEPVIQLRPSKVRFLYDTNTVMDIGMERTTPVSRVRQNKFAVLILRKSSKPRSDIPLTNPQFSPLGLGFLRRIRPCDWLLSTTINHRYGYISSSSPRIFSLQLSINTTPESQQQLDSRQYASNFEVVPSQAPKLLQQLAVSGHRGGLRHYRNPNTAEW
jgi:hypothetical protein